MGRDRKHKPFALGDEGYDAARQQATRFFRSSSTAQPAVRGAAGGSSASEQDIAAAKAERDKMHTTKLSAKVHAQIEPISTWKLENKQPCSGSTGSFVFEVERGGGWGVRQGGQVTRTST